MVIDVPERTDPKWAKLIASESVPELTSLPLKVRLSNIRVKYERAPSQAMLSVCIDELRDFVAHMAHQPQTQQDFKSIFG